MCISFGMVYTFLWTFDKKQSHQRWRWSLCQKKQSSWSSRKTSNRFSRLRYLQNNDRVTSGNLSLVTRSLLQMCWVRRQGCLRLYLLHSLQFVPVSSFLWSKPGMSIMSRSSFQRDVPHEKHCDMIKTSLLDNKKGRSLISKTLALNNFLFHRHAEWGFVQSLIPDNLLSGSFFWNGGNQKGSTCIYPLKLRNMGVQFPPAGEEAPLASLEPGPDFWDKKSRNTLIS